MDPVKDYLQAPLREFLKDAAARQPSPGGGAVAALTGAQAASMACMVLEYTVGKRRFAEYEEELTAALAECRRALAMFEQWMGEDMSAYSRLTAARNANDEQEMAHALGAAIMIPMEIATLAELLVRLLADKKDKVNHYLYSDWQVAAILAVATVETGGVNVRVNARDLEDPRQVAELETQLDNLAARARDARDKVMKQTSK
jgi:formiminotetrahydrofolate cyclodeaminase